MSWLIKLLDIKQLFWLQCESADLRSSVYISCSSESLSIHRNIIWTLKGKQFSKMAAAAAAACSRHGQLIKKYNVKTLKINVS